MVRSGPKAAKSRSAVLFKAASHVTTPRVFPIPLIIVKNLAMLEFKSKISVPVLSNFDMKSFLQQIDQSLIISTYQEKKEHR